MNNITYVVIFGLCFVGLILVNVYGDNSDWESCLNYLEEAKTYVNADWNKSQIRVLCAELLNEGSLYIERENQRDISLTWVSLGEIVRFIF